MKEIKIAYVVSDLKRVGPTNQTLNIIKNSCYKNKSILITLFDESVNDTMIEEYLECGIKVISLKLNRISFCFTGKKKLKKVLLDNDVNIVHSYGIKPDCICSDICNKINIKHIITLRNYPKEDILSRMDIIRGKIALHMHLKALLSCENVVCCSKTVFTKISIDYPEKKFNYIQNGVDTEKFKKVSEKEKNNLRRKYNFDKNTKIFISTGSFIKRKRIDETINAFIKSKVDGILLLLGNGELLESLKEKYSEQKRIIFYGKSNNIEEFLQMSDFFISSSESEGLPNGVIEAISCGLPVILSDILSHKEILEELNNAGYCYELGNINELATLINKIDSFNYNDVDIEQSSFAMTNMAAKYINYYRKINRRLLNHEMDSKENLKNYSR